MTSCVDVKRYLTLIIDDFIKDFPFIIESWWNGVRLNLIIGRAI